MVKLLMMMQAEGNTTFRCRSSSPSALKAFRAAAQACNIPPEQLELTQISAVKRGKSWPVKSKGSTGGMLHEAQVEYKTLRNEVVAEQRKILQEQQQSQIQQQRMEQNDDNQSNVAPNNPSM